MFLFFTLLTSLAFAGECDRVIDLPIRHDTAHTIYKNHGFDVAAYASQHQIGFRDYAPLNILVGDGDYCYNFGSLRDFGKVMGNVGVVVTVNDRHATVIPSVDYDEFYVTGLHVEDVVTVEFIKPSTPKVSSCARTVNDTTVYLIDEHEFLPLTLTLYTCEVEPMSWKVIEQRQYVVTTPATTPPPTPVPSVDGDLHGFELK